MRILFLSYLFFVLFIISCNNAHDTASSIPPVKEKKETSDDLVLQLSMQLHSNPQTLKEKEDNLILNYAIDNNLNVQRTQSGLYYIIKDEGKGELLKWGDKITTHYKGQLLDGKVFDSSYKRDKPLTFYIGNVIKGWNEGLQLLRPEGEALFLVPSYLAYEKKGIPNLIPPNSVLRFDLKILKKEE